MRYEITTFDVCVSGFERLRNRDEFLLCAYPSARSGWRALRDQWLADIQACERPCGFDYAAARRAVCSFAAGLRRQWNGRPNPLNLPCQSGDDSDGPIAFLYVRDTGAARDGESDGFRVYLHIEDTPGGTSSFRGEAPAMAGAYRAALSAFRRSGLYSKDFHESVFAEFYAGARGFIAGKRNMPCATHSGTRDSFRYVVEIFRPVSEVSRIQRAALARADRTRALLG